MDAQPPPARVSNALCLAELLGNTFGHLSARDGWQAAAVCKAWRGPWHQRLKGMLRCVRKCVPMPQANQLVSSAPGGVLVANYFEKTVEHYSPSGALLRVYCDDMPSFSTMEEAVRGLYTPRKVASVSPLNERAWVLENDSKSLVKAQLQDGGRLSDVKFNEGSLTFDVEWEQQPVDLAIAGDALLVLCRDEYSGAYGRVVVLDVDTGAVRYCFGGEIGTAEELRGPESLAAEEGLVYVADMYNHQVKVFKLADGTGALVRTFGRQGIPPEIDRECPYWSIDASQDEDFVYPDDTRAGSGPGEFNQPFGVVVGKGRLYVSESAGRRIQILNLPDGEPLHIVRSPDGFGLAGLCITALPDGTGARVWCAGEYWGDSFTEWQQAHPPAAGSPHQALEVPGRAHIFAICE